MSGLRSRFDFGVTSFTHGRVAVFWGNRGVGSILSGGDNSLVCSTLAGQERVIPRWTPRRERGDSITVLPAMTDGAVTTAAGARKAQNPCWDEQQIFRSDPNSIGLSWGVKDGSEMRPWGNTAPVPTNTV